MKKRRKKHDAEEHTDESWLIPYADLLTLLLALFIVLFSMSTINAEKFARMAEVFSIEFKSGTGVFEYPSPLPSNKMLSPDEVEKTDVANEDFDMEELRQIQGKINRYIQENNLTETFETFLTEEGLMVRIRDYVLFDSGSAEVDEEHREIAREISNLLVMNPPRNIIISGHTDNVPISTVDFSSNWELSVMRAVNFMKIILENEELDPAWFSAKGYGEFSPVASNDTAEGRAKNRRVEILILPRVSEE